MIKKSLELFVVLSWTLMKCEGFEKKIPNIHTIQLSSYFVLLNKEVVKSSKKLLK